MNQTKLPCAPSQACLSQPVSYTHLSGKLAHGYARLPQRTQPPAPAAQTAITLVQDSFTRTVSNGWGTATQGGSYATPSSNAADYSVNGSVGRMSVTTAGTARELLDVYKRQLDKRLNRCIVILIT